MVQSDPAKVNQVCAIKITFRRTSNQFAPHLFTQQVPSPSSRPLPANDFHHLSHSNTPSSLSRWYALSIHTCIHERVNQQKWMQHGISCTACARMCRAQEHAPRPQHARAASSSSRSAELPSTSHLPTPNPRSSSHAKFKFEYEKPALPSTDELSTSEVKSQRKGSFSAEQRLHQNLQTRLQATARQPILHKQKIPFR